MSRGIKDLFASSLLRNYCRNLAAGLRAPKGSGEHRYAIFQIQRVIIPGVSTVLFLASLIAMAVVFGKQVAGGYDYFYAKSDRFDLSVSGWQFQAMKAAKMAGAANPGLDAAIAKAIFFLEKNAFANAGENSGFVYSGKTGIPPNGGATPSMTGCGTLCLQLLGRGNSPCVTAGIQYLERVQPQWPSGRDKDGKPAKVPVYAWYYVTQAKFQKGGKVWDSWNRAFVREVIANQQSDGHWENGDWGGDVYTTCLCTLMLEVYYRYLPSYHKQQDKPDTPKKTSDEPAIQISA